MNKTVVITGASHGIGYQTALEFAKLGFNIVIGYNKSQESALKLLEKLRNLNCLSIAIKADLEHKEQAVNLIEKSISEFGNIDILINNAGISEQKLFSDITYEDWRKMFSVNMDGCFVCTQTAIKYMLNKHKGKIINVSSMWGITGASCEVHYSASKAAIIGFTKALAKEVGPSGIQVNCVAPGLIDTNMNHNLDKTTIDNLINDTPLCKIGSTKDVAKTILFLASEDADFITGQVISPNGGFLI